MPVNNSAPRSDQLPQAAVLVLLDELDKVFSVPLAFFAELANLHLDRFDYGGRSRLVPRYEWGKYSIRGITAAILVKLVNNSCDAELELEDYWLGDS